MDEYAKDKKLNIGEKISNQKKKRIIITVASVAVAIILVLLILYISGVYKHIFNFFGIETEEKYTVSGIAVSLNTNGDYLMSATKDTMVICDETGVTGYDNRGVWKWHEDIIYVSPIMTSYDDFVLIYDSESKKVATYGKDGYLWSKTFEHKIRSAVAHSGTDFITVITDGEEYNSEITITDRTEASKDIFSGKFVDEYIIAASVSPDRTQFALSGMYTEGEETVGVIKFFRMSDGEEYSTEVFDNVFPFVDYVDGNSLIAASSDELIKIIRKPTIDTKGDGIQKIWSRNSGAEMLLNIDVLSDVGFCAAFGMIDETSESSLVNLYNKKGEKVKTHSYKERIASIKAGNNEIAVCTGTALHVFNSNFNIKGEYTTLSDVFQADFISKDLILVQMDSRVMAIEFKPE